MSPISWISPGFPHDWSLAPLRGEMPPRKIVHSSDNSLDHLAGAIWAKIMTGQWWAAPHLEQDCLVMHTSFPLFKSEDRFQGHWIIFVIYSSFQCGYMELIFSLLLTTTSLFNWLIKDKWPSLICWSCQGSRCEPQNSGVKKKKTKTNICKSETVYISCPETESLIVYPWFLGAFWLNKT